MRKIKNKKIAVIGGSGFLGKSLLKLLFNENAEIILFTRKKNYQHTLTKIFPDKYIKCIKWDVDNLKTIEENTKNLIDVGSGAGLPGIVLAIAAKEKKMSFKTYLIDKSPKKSKFLNNAITLLNLNAEVVNKNIFNYEEKPKNSVFIARAFKPLNLILELMHKISGNWKKIIIFMGKTGDRELLQASKIWDIEYKQRVSVTSDDSIVVEINRIKKK